MALDELAYALGIDPVQLRLRNYAEIEPDSGRPWSSKHLRECYRDAAARFGWERRSGAPRSMRDGRELVGWGMATATYPAHRMAAKARATLFPDGIAVVQSGSQDIGTGTYTVMTQVAAESIGIPVGRVGASCREALSGESASRCSSTASWTTVAEGSSTPTLAEYHVPVNADIGQIDVDFIDAPDLNFNPLGVRGIGEIGITGASGAVCNAVYHATGKRIRDPPITLDRLLA